MEVMITRRGGAGGEAGAALTAVTPYAGITVTVSNGEKSHTKTTGADGTAVFSGIPGGTWTVTITDGSNTRSETVEVTMDYLVSLSFIVATINVTYPKGSTCTATNGVTTLTAPDTGGTWACEVKTPGTWTVSCTDGTKSFGRQVTITEDGQEEAISLYYKLYAYNRGDSCTAVTGGWTQYGACSGSFGSSSISFTGNESASTANVTRNAIDITGFTSMVIIGSVSSTANGVCFQGCGLLEADSNNRVVSWDQAGHGGFTKTVDISGLSGAYRPLLQVGLAHTCKGTIYEVYFEV